MAIETGCVNTTNNTAWTVTIYAKCAKVKIEAKYVKSSKLDNIIRISESEEVSIITKRDRDSICHFFFYICVFHYWFPVYFSNPDPSEPLHLEVSSDDPNELIVKWKPPKLPNGIVTHYKITYQKLKFSTKSFEQRDYCHDRK